MIETSLGKVRKLGSLTCRISWDGDCTPEVTALYSSQGEELLDQCFVFAFVFVSSSRRLAVEQSSARSMLTNPGLICSYAGHLTKA